MGDTPFPISWSQVHLDAHALALKLEPLQKWDGIVAVARGGLVPACLVARVLKLRNIQTACVCSYGEEEKINGEIQVISLPDLPDEGENWLVVDDLVDSGGTFAYLRRQWPKAHFACLYAKPKGRATADTFVTEYPQHLWIDFPWEPSPGAIPAPVPNIA